MSPRTGGFSEASFFRLAIYVRPHFQRHADREVDPEYSLEIALLSHVTAPAPQCKARLTERGLGAVAYSHRRPSLHVTDPADRLTIELDLPKRRPLELVHPKRIEHARVGFCQ